MFRIIRTSTLAALRSMEAELDDLQHELEIATAAAGSANAAATRLQALVERQADADREAQAQIAGLREAVRRASAERDAAHAADLKRTEDAARRELDEIHADVARLQAAAADADTGEPVRHALAYGVLRHLFEEAQAHGLELARPLDLVAVILGFPLKPEPPEQPALVDPGAAAHNG
jgi:hypothetical protein